MGALPPLRVLAGSAARAFAAYSKSFGILEKWPRLAGAASGAPPHGGHTFLVGLKSLADGLDGGVYVSGAAVCPLVAGLSGYQNAKPCPSIRKDPLSGEDPVDD